MITLYNNSHRKLEAEDLLYNQICKEDPYLTGYNGGEKGIRIGPVSLGGIYKGWKVFTSDPSAWEAPLLAGRSTKTEREGGGVWPPLIRSVHVGLLTIKVGRKQHLWLPPHYTSLSKICTRRGCWYELHIGPDSLRDGPWEKIQSSCARLPRGHPKGL